MAEGAWVPAYDSLWDGPKTARLARELGLDMEKAGAKFLKLMAWAREHVESGELGRVEDRALIAKAVGLALTRGDELYRALQLAGFITDDERGYVVGWEDGPGKLVASRRIDRLRKAHDRGTHEGTLVSGCPKCLRSLTEGARNGLAKSMQPPRDPRPMPTRSPRDPHASTGRPVVSHAPSTGQAPAASTDKKESGDVSGGRPMDAPDLSTRTETTETRGDQTRTSPFPQDAPPQAAEDQARLAWVLASAGEEHGWRAVVAELAKTHALANVETWFTNTRAEILGEALVVVAPNAFAASWLQNKYAPQIREVRAALGQDQLPVAFVTEQRVAELRLQHVQRANASTTEPEIPDAPASDQDQPFGRIRDGAA